MIGSYTEDRTDPLIVIVTARTDDIDVTCQRAALGGIGVGPVVVAQLHTQGATPIALMEGQNDYRQGRHVVSAMHVHLVFVTKYRRGVFDDEMPTRCEEIMRKVCEDFQAELKEFNGERDYVHLSVHYRPRPPRCLHARREHRGFLQESR